jgi:hypothetical protein
MRNFVKGLLERLGGVIGRQHHGNLFVREHQTSAEQPLLIADYARIFTLVNSPFEEHHNSLYYAYLVNLAVVISISLILFH